jgi:hypothetical protein
MNTLTLILVITIVCIFRDPDSLYFRLGPSEDLVIISIRINTWNKWCVLLLFIGIIKSVEVIVNELGSPVLAFSVYNPDKKHIIDFTKNELNFLTNSMWFVNGIRVILLIVVSVTQFDIALLGAISSEIVSIFTVRQLLNEKTFSYDKNKKYDKSDCDEDIPLIDVNVINNLV